MVQVRAEGPKAPEAARPERAEAHLRNLSNQLILLPKLAHILQTLALGLRNQFPYEDSGYDTDGSIQAIGKPMAEVIARR